MRPKTFPATTYSGNSRQRLQEIREGLKQPSKSSAQGPPAGPNDDASLAAKVLGGKDAARQQQQQQQLRAPPKFGPYQKALREIRYSLLPFANESGPPAAAEVNRQMLQELVNAGCDQVGVTPPPPGTCAAVRARQPLSPAETAQGPGTATRSLRTRSYVFLGQNPRPVQWAVVWFPPSLQKGLLAACPFRAGPRAFRTRPELYPSYSLLCPRKGEKGCHPDPFSGVCLGLF